jgi:hypothetical protein
MKLVRYRSASGEKPGLILDGEIFDLSGLYGARTAPPSSLPGLTWQSMR